MIVLRLSLSWIILILISRSSHNKFFLLNFHWLWKLFHTRHSASGSWMRWRCFRWSLILNCPIFISSILTTISTSKFLLRCLQRSSWRFHSGFHCKFWFGTKHRFLGCIRCSFVMKFFTNQVIYIWSSCWFFGSTKL